MALNNKASDNKPKPRPKGPTRAITAPYMRTTKTREQTKKKEACPGRARAFLLALVN